MRATLPLLQATDFPPLSRARLETLQVNLGYLCNQRCLHCHVNAGPTRKELMDTKTLSLIVPVLKARHINTLDLTGGAPEMHPDFRTLVTQAVDAGVHVIDRCNLTILLEPGFETLSEFLAQQRVEIVASLPCYAQKNVDQQRGEGVFDKSIRALKQLNTLGYGQPDSGLILNLVYNPQGPTLPPEQSALEESYRQRLEEDFHIRFNHLFVLANMPINRFGSMLISKGMFEDYMQLLKNNFKTHNLEQVMCRSLVSVDYQGYLYDCDFNQQLSMPMLAGRGKHLSDLLSQSLDGHDICVADHCYGCTAGQGSSCGGAL